MWNLKNKTLSSLFVLCPQLGQGLLLAGLPAGDPVKVATGGLADWHVRNPSALCGALLRWGEKPLHRYAVPLPFQGRLWPKAPLKGELSPKVTEGFITADSA